MEVGIVAPVSSLKLDSSSRATLKLEILALCREVLKVEPISNDQELFILGYDQLLGVEFLKKIGAQYKIEISPSVLRDALSVSKLADLVELMQSSEDHRCIVPIKPDGVLPPLFLVHGVGGNVLGFFDLAKKFPAEQPVYGIQAQALYRPEKALIRLSDLAAYYLREVRRIQPSGPYHFTGLSFGGLVAYEMAQQLHEQGETVGLLGLMDTWQPQQMRQSGSTLSPRRLIGIRHKLSAAMTNTQNLSYLSKLSYLSIRLKSRARLLSYLYLTATGQSNMISLMRSVRDINWMAALSYKLKPYSGKVVLFRAASDDASHLPVDFGWGAMVQGGLKIHHFPEDHGRMLAEPGVTKLAEAIMESLEQFRHAANFNADLASSAPKESERTQTGKLFSLATMNPSEAGTFSERNLLHLDEIEI